MLVVSPCGFNWLGRDLKIAYSLLFFCKSDYPENSKKPYELKKPMNCRIVYIKNGNMGILGSPCICLI
jgi:hypothetical protein